MNKKLELLRVKSELAAVSSARSNMEFKIEEHMDNVMRLQDHIKVQVAKEKELTEKLSAMDAAQE